MRGSHCSILDIIQLPGWSEIEKRVEAETAAFFANEVPKLKTECGQEHYDLELVYYKNPNFGNSMTLLLNKPKEKEYIIGGICYHCWTRFRGQYDEKGLAWVKKSTEELNRKTNPEGNLKRGRIECIDFLFYQFK